ncbi:MAG: hypothetical protein NC048_02285 [Bacteroides sp.]|nr:hypothetical protein [Ruminococcus flavefaciens]MCM1554305.1 hypothetical protein [Bacteroides sp.]
MTFLLLTACNPCAHYAQRCAPETTRDSVWSHDTLIVERFHTDTLQPVALPKESIANTVISPDTATAETSLAHATAWLHQNQLHLTLRNKDTAQLLIAQLKELQRRITHQGRQTQTTQHIIEYRTRPLTKYLATTGAIALLYLLFQIVRRTTKLFK